jgi:hypothetical protein
LLYYVTLRNDITYVHCFAIHQIFGIKVSHALRDSAKVRCRKLGITLSSFNQEDPSGQNNYFSCKPDLGLYRASFSKTMDLNPFNHTIKIVEDFDDDELVVFVNGLYKNETDMAEANSDSNCNKPSISSSQQFETNKMMACTAKIKFISHEKIKRPLSTSSCSSRSSTSSSSSLCGYQVDIAYPKTTDFDTGTSQETTTREGVGPQSISDDMYTSHFPSKTFESTECVVTNISVKIGTNSCSDSIDFKHQGDFNFYNYQSYPQLQSISHITHHYSNFRVSGYALWGSNTPPAERNHSDGNKHTFSSHSCDNSCLQFEHDNDTSCSN